MESNLRRGFTLLEMSIVLVIIAVIVAGVLVGRSMVTSSQLQTVMTDAGNYISAVGNFKSTYQALPGDYAIAETQWGTSSGGCTYGTGTGTCNGDGDGRIGPVCNSGSMDLLTHGNESFRFWQHLNSAGLFINSLNGTSPASTYAFLPGINSPAGPIDGSGFNIMWLDDPSASTCTNFWQLIPSTGAYGNAFIFSTKYDAVVLTAEQADNIDRKMDDGIPSSGKVRSFGTLTPNCTVSSSGNYTYNVTYKGRACQLIFLTNY